MRRCRIESLKFAVGLLLIGACRTAPVPSEPAPAASRTAASEREAERFGARIRGGEPGLAVRELLAKPEAFEGKSVLVNGYVRRACSRRGCWMELAEGSDEKNPGCRVTFKDYGFFVPTNSAGATARVEAKVVLASVSPSSVNHMESEGASFANKTADGSAREVRLVATGVELFR
jgi:hypothetical protein